MEIIKNLVDENKYRIKCPYAMTPTRIVVHETSNDASAQDEIAYMRTNNLEKSFHFAVDDKEIVQGIPLDRNAWHAGDGNGKGNREGIAIEICYSKSGGERWKKAIDNAARFIAELLKERKWGVDKITKHQDYSGKICPHRILGSYGWNNFINLISKYLKELNKVKINVVLPQLEKGNKGTHVKALQILLNGYGYNFVPDSSFGDKTFAAVKDFQKKSGMGVDGICGIKTWNKLLGN